MIFHQTGIKILFTCTEDNLTERPFTVTSLYQMDLKYGNTVLLFKDPFINSAKFISEDGLFFIVSGSGEAFGGKGLHIKKDGQISNMSDKQLFFL